jgi:transposase
MTKAQVEVITSVERRRRWSRAEKERIVAASLEAGAVASAVAREAGIHASQLFRWRQELCGLADAAPGFAAVTIAPRAEGEPGGCGVRWTDRDRVGRRSAAADQRRGECRDGQCGDCGSDGKATVTVAVPNGAKVWLSTGYTDMRKGFDGLALLVQETLKRDPHNGQLFVFRGRRGGLIKVLWYDGQGMCLFAKRLERGRFIWPSTAPRDGAERTVAITPAQLGYLLEGIDWRLPQHTWRPQAAG